MYPDPVPRLSHLIFATFVRGRFYYLHYTDTEMESPSLTSLITLHKDTKAVRGSMGI